MASGMSERSVRACHCQEERYASLDALEQGTCRGMCPQMRCRRCLRSAKAASVCSSQDQHAEDALDASTLLDRSAEHMRVRTTTLQHIR